MSNLVPETSRCPKIINKRLEKASKRQQLKLSQVIALGFDHAGRHGLPVVVECRSGGARMQEGTLSLMQLAKTSVCVEKHRRAGLPFISVLNDPTYGGVPASYAMQSDVRIGVSGARIGFAGPAVILNTMYEMDQANFDAECPSDFQSAEYLQAHGQLDMVVPSPEDLEAAVADIVAVLHGVSRRCKEVREQGEDVPEQKVRLLRLGRRFLRVRVEGERV